MKRILVGPSHIVRWQTNIARGAAPAVGDEVVFAGFGGAPIWSKKLAEQVAREYEANNTEIILLVGDTRFGNAICANDYIRDADYPFADGYEAIDRSKITKPFDLQMMHRVEAAIDEYVQVFGNAVRVIYWDTIGRRVMDVMAGRHIGAHGYDHPSWGRAFPGAERGPELIALQDLFDFPMGEVSRIYLDDSIHPTTIGYYLLSDLVITGSSVPVAFNRARTHVTQRFIKTVIEISGGNRILIAGDSIWIDTLRRLMSGSGMDSVAKFGIDIKSSGASSPRDHISTVDFDVYDHLVLVSHERTLDEFLNNNPRLRETLARKDTTVTPRYFSWEGALSLLFADKEFVSKRPLPPDFSPAEYEAQWGRAYQPELVREIIELGLRGEPTFRGISTLLECYKN